MGLRGFQLCIPILTGGAGARSLQLQPAASADNINSRPHPRRRDFFERNRQ